MSSVNPYASTVSTMPLEQIEENSLASRNQRFLTLLVDSFAMGALGMAVNFVIGFLAVGFTSGQATDEGLAIVGIVSGVINMFLSTGYYILFEFATGQTLGKMFLGTKVTTADGKKASFGQILGRSFCRLIPLEALSFFGNKGFPIGWHDRFSKTRVVKIR